MPPRWARWAIVGFWLATTTELIRHEMASRLRTGDPPPYAIDLTDEVGAKVVNWVVLQKDVPVGTGFSQTMRQPDGTFELTAQVKLDKPFRVFIDFHDFRAVTSYRVTAEGSLVSAKTLLKFKVDLPVLGRSVVEFDFAGQVRDGEFHPQLQVLLDGQAMPVPPLTPCAVSGSGRILNPMHLVNRVNGLRVGQRWPVPLLDPLRAAPAAARDLVPAQETMVAELTAEVKLDDLLWNDAVEPCFKIEYARRDAAPLAATWVRCRDGLVLQQWAAYEGIEFTMRRMPRQ
ncbi:MAG: hypothetical protein NZO58_10885 [Gemmataceae bacterium]|nr:hypothetical protein [Gemmataceae bacterium]